MDGNDSWDMTDLQLGRTHRASRRGESRPLTRPSSMRNVSSPWRPGVSSSSRPQSVQRAFLSLKRASASCSWTRALVHPHDDELAGQPRAATWQDPPFLTRSQSPLPPSPLLLVLLLLLLPHSSSSRAGSSHCLASENIAAMCVSDPQSLYSSRCRCDCSEQACLPRAWQLFCAGSYWTRHQ